MNGTILATHRIGDITILEKRIKHLELPDDVGFEVVKDKAGRRIYPALDMAIIGALALKYDGLNTQADKFVCRILGIEGDFWS